MKHSIANTTCISIRACGLPKNVAHEAINEVVKWVKCSGAEWAVTRLKELKLLYVRSLSGDSYKPDWVALHKNGTPKGAFKNVFKCKKPHKVLAALMVYTGFKAKKVTNKQFRKFDSSAEMSDFPRKWGEPEFRAFSDTQLERLTGMPKSVKNFWEPERDKFATIEAFLNRGIRVPSFKTCGSSKTTELLSIDSVINSMAHPFFQWWMEARSNVPAEYFETYTASPLLGNPILRFGHFSPVGRVSFIQEAGYKLRAVFNPLPCFQLALSSLGYHLFNYLRKIPEDCTFDQQKGIEDTRAALSTGMCLATLDLSDATNSFPMEVTMYVLRNLRVKGINRVDLELFEAVSTAPWNYPPNPMGKERVCLNRGQPLGLYPSFAAFALSHHAIVRALKPKFYRILGDDIVIDAETAVKLRQCYMELGVKLSEAKCFQSTQLAEFAGKIIYLEKVYNQPKHHALNDRNFVDILRSLPQFSRFLRPRQRKVASCLQRMHRADSPYGLASRYIDNDEQPLIASYFISSLLAEQFAGHEPKDLTYISPNGRLLKRLAYRIKLRHIRKGVRNAFSGYDVEGNIETIDVNGKGNVETTILETVGVTQVESSKPVSGWVSENNEIPKGDPRDYTTLDTLEHKGRKAIVDQIVQEALLLAFASDDVRKYLSQGTHDLTENERIQPEGPVVDSHDEAIVEQLDEVIEVETTIVETEMIDSNEPTDNIIESQELSQDTLHGYASRIRPRM